MRNTLYLSAEGYSKNLETQRDYNYLGDVGPLEKSLLLFAYFGLGTIPYSAQGILLVLCSGLFLVELGHVSKANAFTLDYLFSFEKFTFSFTNSCAP